MRTTPRSFARTAAAMLAAVAIVATTLGGALAGPAGAAPQSKKLEYLEGGVETAGPGPGQGGSATEPAVRPGVKAPPLPAGSGDGRRAVYSNSQQRVWLVESNGAVSRSYLVSGRRGVPRAGTYSVFSKSRYTSNGSVRMEYMVRFARGRSLAIGFHSIPVDRRGRPIQSTSQLGTARSAGCVRQAVPDAAHLYEWAPVGTKVVVTP